MVSQWPDLVSFNMLNKKLTKEHNVNESDMRYVLDDLEMFSKAKAPHHLITGSAKLEILGHCQTLLHTIKMQWPPSSSDIIPPDYSKWALVETEACKTPKSSVAHLKASIKTAWQIMATNYIYN